MRISLPEESSPETGNYKPDPDLVENIRARWASPNIKLLPAGIRLNDVATVEKFLESGQVSPNQALDFTLDA